MPEFATPGATSQVPGCHAAAALWQTAWVGTIRDAFHVNAPLELVWDMNADCARIPEWNLNVIEVKGCPGRIDRVGARFTTVATLLGQRVDATVETTMVDKHRAMEQRGVSGSGRASARVEFSATHHGTDVAMRFDYQVGGGLFGGLAERLAHGRVERDIRRSNIRFKRLCEAAAHS